ncbi:hypothetical protein KC644_01345 [Candidatus Berkelbacteria bacterium]|nr:hypothetical protein [Candidatus Berkelbacteria bacterium]
MEITVHYNKLPISPRKLRALLGYVKKGQAVPVAVAQLEALPNTTSEPIKKLLLASVSAAKDRRPSARPADVRVVEIYCNEAARMYRTRIKGRGRASRFAKRGSHLTLKVEVAGNVSSRPKAKSVETKVKSKTTATSASKDKSVKKKDA